MVPPRRAKVTITSSDDEAFSEHAAETAKTDHGAQHGSTNRESKSTIGNTIRSATQAASAKTTRAKPRGSPRKAATQVGDRVKPIYSFFNAVTERQDHSKLSASAIPQTVLHQPEELETINDDSDDHSDAVTKPIQDLSMGSTVALAVRKRKLQRSQSFDNDSAHLSSGSQKFRKASGGGRLSPGVYPDIRAKPWSEQFGPTNLDQLAVHHRKVSDTRQWVVQAMQSHRRKVLVLKGPTGTGKTSTIKLLARNMGLELLEWSELNASEQITRGFNSPSLRFEEFITRAGRSNGSLALANVAPVTKFDHEESKKDSTIVGSRVLLIEDFPSTFSRDSNALQAFRTTISQYLASSLPAKTVPVPIVMIVSETPLSSNTSTSDTFTVHRLLGPELIAHPYVNVIEFNPIAPTFMLKALEAIILKEARKSGRKTTPGPQVLKQLAEIGDIRSAVSALEFLCLRGDGDKIWSNKVVFTKSKKPKIEKPLTAAEEEVLKLITHRESSLGIFHSVGKVVYNKRSENLQGHEMQSQPLHLAQYRHSLVPEMNPDSLMNELSTDVPTFVAALHENYALSCSSPVTEDTLVSLSDCMSDLSDADLLCCDTFSSTNRTYTGSSVDSLRQEEICFQLSVRGISYNLPYPVHRSSGAYGKQGEAHRMSYPSSLRIWRQQGEIEDNLDLLASFLSDPSATSTIPASSTPSLHGIESWGMLQTDKFNQPRSPSGKDVILTVQLEAKHDMILNRLPYTAWLLSHSKRHTWQIPPSIKQSLTFVTSLVGSTAEIDALDDGISIEAGRNIMSGEDRPNNGRSLTPVTKDSSAITNRLSQAHGQHLESTDARTSIAAKVQSLILEEDDIVDD